jgi:hypothetical protein
MSSDPIARILGEFDPYPIGWELSLHSEVSPTKRVFMATSQGFAMKTLRTLLLLLVILTAVVYAVAAKAASGQAAARTLTDLTSLPT